MNNLGLKAASLLLASLLSIFVHNFFMREERSTSVLQLLVPLEVRDLPENLVIVAPASRQVEVALRGPSLSLSRVVTAEPLFSVDVPAGTSSSFVANLRQQDLQLPLDVEVLSIKPAQIEFKLETIVERSVPVVVPRIGTLPEGLVLKEIRVSPEAMTVRGPSSEVHMLVNLETAPLDLRGLRESATRILSVRSPGAQSVTEGSSVKVDLQILERSRERTFRSLGVQLRGAPGASKLEVLPRTVLVEVSGPERVVNLLEQREVVPYVNASGGNSGGVAQNVEVELPPEISAIRIDPSTVQIVELSQKSEKRIRSSK